MNLYAFLALLSCVSFFAIGVLVFTLDTKSRLHRLFFLFCASAGVYSFAEFGYLQAESYETAFLWIKVRSVWVFTFAFALHFMLLFTEKKWWLQRKFTYILLYGVPTVLFVLDISTFLVTGAPIRPEGSHWTFDAPVATPVHLIASLYALNGVLLPLSMTFFYFRKQTIALKRKQAKYIFFANLVLFFEVVFNTFFIKAGPFKDVHLDSVLLVVANMVIAYAIWQFRLFNVTPKMAADEIITTMSNFLVLTDTEGNISAINEATVQLSGYQEVDLLEQPVEIFFKKNGQLLQADSEASANSRLVLNNQEHTFFTKNGVGIPILLSVIRTPIRQGKETGFAYIGSNLTDIKKAEQKLTAYAHELEVSNKELERSNDDLRQFAYVASHDLKEPLRMTNCYVQLLEMQYKDQLDETAMSYIKLASEGVYRMNDLIEALLEHSSINREGQEFEQTDLNTVLEKTLTILQPQITTLQATLIYPNLPTLAVDEHQIGRLFQNLISNALKYHDPNRSPKIVVKAEQKEDLWQFSVKDNGIGIEEKYWQKIFAIFQRLHSRDRYAGTGIGLSICKKIVERHGGTIWAKSKIGVGTTVYFTLC